MWIASKIGFFSIVELNKPKQKGGFQVRARLRVDIENLQKHLRPEYRFKIIESNDSDYRYRIVFDSDEAIMNGIYRKDVFAVLMESIDYTNFKDEISLTPGQTDKKQAYMKIWSTMYKLQALESPGESFSHTSHCDLSDETMAEINELIDYDSE